MKIVVMTTETTHHSYFVQTLKKKYDVNFTFIENIDTSSEKISKLPFEIERDSYEKNIWLRGNYQKIKSLGPSLVVRNINDTKVYKKLLEINPNIIIVFGTKKLDFKIVNTFRNVLWNLHGGNPEMYRGLDSHLWTIYEENFKELKTCIHRVDLTLDTGEIFNMLPLPITKKTHLYNLRAINTEICLKLSYQLIEQLINKGEITSRKQNKKGKYFSSIPIIKKEECVTKFINYVENL